MTDYICRLIRAFPHFTLGFVIEELPMDEGWVFYGWSVENDGWLAFAGLKRDGDGYIAQERKRILNDAN